MARHRKHTKVSNVSNETSMRNMPMSAYKILYGMMLLFVVSCSGANEFFNMSLAKRVATNEYTTDIFMYIYKDCANYQQVNKYEDKIEFVTGVDDSVNSYVTAKCIRESYESRLYVISQILENYKPNKILNNVTDITISISPNAFCHSDSPPYKRMVEATLRDIQEEKKKTNNIRTERNSIVLLEFDYIYVKADVFAELESVLRKFEFQMSGFGSLGLDMSVDKQTWPDTYKNLEMLKNIRVSVDCAPVVYFKKKA